MDPQYSTINYDIPQREKPLCNSALARSRLMVGWRGGTGIETRRSACGLRLRQQDGGYIDEYVAEIFLDELSDYLLGG
jgi:hypothetical protein